MHVYRQALQAHEAQYRQRQQQLAALFAEVMGWESDDSTESRTR
jgi:hypothetical protein